MLSFLSSREEVRISVMKLVSAMGSLARQRFAALSGDPQLLFFCWRLRGVLCASLQAQLKAMAGPGCATLTAASWPRCSCPYFGGSSNLLLPSQICSSSCADLYSPVLGCCPRRGRRKSSSPRSDMVSYTEHIP